MSQHANGESSELVPGDDKAQEIGRLVGLVKRLERENSSLRRELATVRPRAA